MAYQYSSHDNISLHDCRATELRFGEHSLTFVFADGFYVLEQNEHNNNKKLSYTDKSEAEFKTYYKNINENLTVYLFSETDEENKSVREEISPAAFAEMLHQGMELEFLSAYKGEQGFLFECWLWSDAKPHHKECMIQISADDVIYKWNTLYVE